MKTVRITLATVVAAGLAAFVWTAFVGAQEAAALQQKDAPPDGVWISSLDLSKVALRPARTRARPRAGAAQPATPPPPPVYALGGVTYPHTVPLVSDRDMTIDLKGRAVRFASMVGIDDSVGAGRGSVIFGVWVDGKKVADSGVMKGGDAPKLLSADLKGAKRLVARRDRRQRRHGRRHRELGRRADHDGAGRAGAAGGRRAAGRGRRRRSRRAARLCRC